jgi:hypothetical protein
VIHNIFDSVFNGMGRSEFYRSLLTPDLFPHEKPMLVENWPAEDREAYCGGEFIQRRPKLTLVIGAA